jgi:hypothetical protein
MDRAGNCESMVPLFRQEYCAQEAVATHFYHWFRRTLRDLCFLDKRRLASYVVRIASGCTDLVPESPDYQSLFELWTNNQQRSVVLEGRILREVRGQARVVGVTVRRERRWTSAGATPARELVRSTR